MAERKKTKRPSRAAQRPAKRRSPLFTAFRRPQADFRPDSQGSGLLKVLHFTQLQRMILLRWSLYILVCVLALVMQDTIMSRVALLGATTDLPVCAILMITIMEGAEVGSIFALLASIVYHFSGTAPGAYCVALITLLGLLIGLFRQKFWHRSPGSIIMCTSIAVMAYEIGLYIAGLFLGLTRWNRLGIFLLTGLYSVLVLIPLYYLIHRIGLIGGNTWKE